ncbi:MAG: UvrB/UvrC motif-containing protein [Planctomycetota bacterium]
MTHQPCEICGEPATVHEVVVKNGKRQERHLCEKHAAELGLLGSGSHTSAMQALGAVLDPMLSKSKPQAPSGCPGCGMSFADFRQHGVLGCPSCYSAFEDELGSLIERAHEGATCHVGKVPKRAAGLESRLKKIESLRKELQGAVMSEDYERAASIRDRLSSLEKNS